MQKNWYKTKTGVVALILLWPILVPAMFIKYLYGKSRNMTYAVGAVALIMCVTVALIDENNTEEQTKSMSQNSKNTAVDETETNKEQGLSDKPMERIDQLVQKQSKKLSTTLINIDGLTSAEENSSPWIVVINSELNSFVGCNSAKETAYNITRSLYTDNTTKTKIAQVKISLSPQIQIGLGSKDASSIDEETWMLNGYTNFIKSLATVGNDDDLRRDVQNRTFFKSINSECST